MVNGYIDLQNVSEYDIQTSKIKLFAKQKS